MNFSILLVASALLIANVGCNYGSGYDHHHKYIKKHYDSPYGRNSYGIDSYDNGVNYEIRQTESYKSGPSYARESPRSYGIHSYDSGLSYYRSFSY